MAGTDSRLVLHGPALGRALSAALPSKPESAGLALDSVHFEWDAGLPGAQLVTERVSGLVIAARFGTYEASGKGCVAAPKTAVLVMRAACKDACKVDQLCVGYSGVAIKHADYTLTAEVKPTSIGFGASLSHRVQPRHLVVPPVDQLVGDMLWRLHRFPPDLKEVWLSLDVDYLEISAPGATKKDVTHAARVSREQLCEALTACAKLPAPGGIVRIAYVGHAIMVSTVGSWEHSAELDAIVPLIR